MNKGLKLLLDNIPFPIWIKDLDLKFVYVNNIYAQIYNKTKDDFIGFTNENIFVDDICKKYNDHCLEVIKHRQAKQYEAYINDKFHQSCIFPLIDENDKMLAIVGIVGVQGIDELEEKNMEIEIQKNLTKQIIDILPGVIFYKDKDSKYVYANKECQDFYKEKGIDNILGKTDMDLHCNKNIARTFLEDDRKIIERKEPIHKEGIVETKDGIKQYRDVVKMPLLDSTGQVMGIVGRSIDLTRVKENEKKLEYLSYTDILTGAKNRTYFEEQILNLSKEEKLPLGIIMGDTNGLKLVNDTFGHDEGDRLLKLTTDVLKDACQDIGQVFRIGGDEFVILIPNTNSKVCEDMIKKIIKKCNEYEDDIFKISISLGTSIKEDNNKDVFEVLKEAEDKVYRHKLLQEGSIKSSVFSSLKIGLGVKNMETEEHTRRVSTYAIQVGKKLDLEISSLDELIIVGELHDIGKIGISEEILIKEGALTDEEYEIMKTHAEKGYRIIKASGELKNVAKGVLHHHERWDGKGYPMGLKREEIPLISRIISVVDAYDVMTNESVYKKAISRDEAIKELERCAGTQFDPVVVEKFIECIV